MAGRRRVSAPIVTEKHYAPQTVTTIAFGAIENRDVIIAVPVVDKNASTEVEEGSVIKAVYIERWITSDDTGQTSFTLTVEKQPAGATDMTFAQSGALNSYLNKKNILYTTQGLANPVAGVAMPAIRQWILIPKGKQRFGLGDKLIVNITGLSNGINVCGISIFKEWK